MKHSHAGHSSAEGWLYLLYLPVLALMLSLYLGLYLCLYQGCTCAHAVLYLCLYPAFAHAPLPPPPPGAAHWQQAPQRAHMVNIRGRGIGKNAGKMHACMHHWQT